METIMRAWKALIRWFEHGDLVPLIVLVSGVHYAVILQGHDFIAVAIAIGLLVDLGHYRGVRAAVRYRTPAGKIGKLKRAQQRREMLVRWGMAIFMTVVSFGYQQTFYNNLLFSTPLPLLVIYLAWLGEKDKHVGGKVTKVATTPAEVATPAAKPAKPVAEVATAKTARSWKDLPDEDRQLVSGMSPAEIVETYDLPVRTAHNWHKYARNGHSNEKVAVPHDSTVV